MATVRMYWLGQPIEIKFRFEFRPVVPSLGKLSPSAENMKATAIVFDSLSRQLGHRMRATRTAEGWIKLRIPKDLIKEMGTYTAQFLAKDGSYEKTFPVTFVVADPNLVDVTETLPVDSLTPNSTDTAISRAISATTRILRKRNKGSEARTYALNSARVRTERAIEP